MRISTLAITAALVLGACSGDKDKDGTPTDPTGDTGTTATTGVVSDFVVEQGEIAGVMIATMTTAEVSDVRLVYGLSGEALTIEHPTTSNGTEHRFVVLGVKTGREYDFQAIVTVDDEEATSEPVTARVASADPSIPVFTLYNWEPGISCMDGGYILLSYLGNNNSGVAILDRDADIVWAVPFKQTNVQLSRVRPALDGTSLIYTTADGNRQDQIGEHVKQPMDGSTPDVLSTPRSHHDFVELPDGTIGWLDYPEFDAYSNCTSGTSLPDPSQDVALDRIFESPFGGSQVEIYDMWTDYPRTLDCSIDDEEFLKNQNAFDLVHSNSIAYRASDDAYFHMSRWQDGFHKVDRATGSFVWQLGGEHNDFTPAAGQDAAELFNHSHMSEIWDDGLLIFNNNDFGPNYPASKGPSKIQEYHLDETAMTWEVTWSWESDKGFESLLGDARRMPVAGCDNLLISLSQSGIIRELTRDGQFPWAIGAPLGNVTSRVHFIPDIYDLTTAQHP